MLSLIGWLNSLTGSSVLIFGSIFGSLVIYRSIKKNIKFLFYTGLLILFVGLLYLGQFVDFITILITGKNLNPPYLYAILCYMWITPGIVTAMYLGSELMVPEKKKIIISIYGILGIIFELFLWLDTANSFIFNLPSIPGENIIDVNFNRTHPTFFFIVLFIISVITFLFMGFLYKGLQTSGILRKKFILLSIGFLMFALTGTLDSLSSPGNFLFFVRFGMISSSWFWYFGLKEEKIKSIESAPLKKKIYEDPQVKLIKTLNKLKPGTITESEVIFNREQIICLVCKGKVEGFNFICPECHAMYCENCAKSLMDLENACWVCNGPIDKEKPIKKIEEIEEIIVANQPNKIN